MEFYTDGSDHKCTQCGALIMTVFKDLACTKPYEDQDVCVSCLEFGGTVDKINPQEEEDGNVQI